MAVDATKRQRPSSDHHPGIRGAGHEDPSTTVTHGATDGAPANPSFPSPSSRSTGCTTFAKLCREDTDDIASFEDEKPPVATGKRVMFAEVEDEPLRPARRVVHLFVLSCRPSVLDYRFPPLLSSPRLFRPSHLRVPRAQKHGRASGVEKLAVDEVWFSPPCLFLTRVPCRLWRRLLAPDPDL